MMSDEHESNYLLTSIVDRSLGQALNPHVSGHPAVFGTWWNENIILCEWHQLPMSDEMKP
jgi:hypothetical protein